MFAYAARAMLVKVYTSMSELKLHAEAKKNSVASGICPFATIGSTDERLRQHSN